MSLKNPKAVLFLIMIVAALVMAGCPAAATPAPAQPATGAEPPTGSRRGVPTGPQVGIVLPTKDEPRWLQDEARFKELLATANVPSRSSSARVIPPRRRPTSSPCSPRASR